jgi:hypothetical protein
MFVRYAMVLALAFVLASCRSMLARGEDAFEDNDSLERATALAFDTPIEGEAHEEDPDVFSVELAAAGELVWTLESLGHEDCAALAVFAPGGEVLYRDARSRCGHGGRPSASTSSVTIERRGTIDYVTVRADRTGRYGLEILELGQADNELPFSWSYRLRVRRR